MFHFTPAERSGQSDVENPSKNSSLASVRPRTTAGSDLLIFLKSRDKIEALLKNCDQKDLLFAEINRSTSSTWLQKAVPEHVLPQKQWF